MIRSRLARGGGNLLWHETRQILLSPFGPHDSQALRKVLLAPLQGQSRRCLTHPIPNERSGGWATIVGDDLEIIDASLALPEKPGNGGNPSHLHRHSLAWRRTWDWPVALE